MTSESISQYLLNYRKNGGILWKPLCLNGGWRYRCRKEIGDTGMIKDRVEIERWLPGVAQRGYDGDWRQILFKGLSAVVSCCLSLSVRPGSRRSRKSPEKSVMMLRFVFSKVRRTLHIQISTVI